METDIISAIQRGFFRQVCSAHLVNYYAFDKTRCAAYQFIT